MRARVRRKRRRACVRKAVWQESRECPRRRLRKRVGVSTSSIGDFKDIGKACGIDFVFAWGIDEPDGIAEIANCHVYAGMQAWRQTRPGDTVSATAVYSEAERVQNRAFRARLWKSRCISTGSDVQKRVYWRQAVFSPTSMQGRYNPCPASSRCRKPLILWRKFFLSTTTSSFTITTSRIHIRLLL